MRAKPEERAQIIQAAQANIKNQDLTAQAQLALTNFSTQMQRASGVLEKVFAESLKNLAGLLAQLSHAIVDAVANLYAPTRSSDGSNSLATDSSRWRSMSRRRNSKKTSPIGSKEFRISFDPCPI